MIKSLFICLIAVTLVFALKVTQNNEDKPWMNVKLTPRERALQLLAKMNQDEKLAMVHGYGGQYVGNVNANNRLNIPALHLEDGPQGVADGVRQITAWPSALTVVSTWDPQLMYLWASAMAKEQRGKGTNVMLGPMINIARVPVGGRNFESFGEDPVLAATLVVPSVQGIQSQGVIACAKHYVDNNQEHDRTSVSANVDERTQYEIYYPAFKAAVDAGVGSIMCSYNRINSTYACENEVTLQALKKDMDFQGWVMSDWGATHSTVKAANAGLDQQMPDESFFGKALAQAVSSGQVSQSRLEDMVLRILTPMFAIGLFDNPQTGNIDANVQTPEHTALARRLAGAANVLVKNEKNLLPITSSVRKIAVLGDDGHDKPTATGGGSGGVQLPYLVTPLDGIKSRAGSNAQVTYANTKNVQQAVALAKEAEIAIVFVSTWSSEGSDRGNLGLGTDQDNLVSAVAAAQPKTVVVIHTPGAVVTPWVNQVAGIIVAWFPGQEDGNAIADVLFGDVNPSGKLPVTFPVNDSSIPVNTPAQYPGINEQGEYSEKLLVGYRWYDAKNVAPQFPFGHGLSYTTFQYSNLKVSSISTGGAGISVDIKNTGSVAGSEVVQLYIGFPSSAGEPPSQLRKFSKITLAAGATQTVSFKLGVSDVSIWDVQGHMWQQVRGTFNVLVGSSSRDIRVRGTFTN